MLFVFGVSVCYDMSVCHVAFLGDLPLVCSPVLDYIMLVLVLHVFMVPRLCFIFVQPMHSYSEQTTLFNRTDYPEEVSCQIHTVAKAHSCKSNTVCT